jgi:hypothetical protein
MDLPPFVKNQIEINRKERDEKIEQLPLIPKHLLLSFLKDHQVAENRIINEFHMPKAQLAPIRFLPMFHVLRGIGNYQGCPEIAKEFIEYLNAADIEVTMTLQDMQHHLLITLLNHDVPHFISYLGNLYYEIVGEEHLIGKVKE